MAATCAYCAGDALEKCSMCERPICPDHTQRALPYLALGEMLKTIFGTLFRAPRTLPALLFEPGEEEPFCPDCLRLNSQRRVQEQRKFFYLVIGLLAVCALTVYLLVRFL
jgi:hypothetical protein